MLKQIRKNIVLNKMVRSVLKSSSSFFLHAHRFLINRWPTSGVIPCRFGPYRFKLYNRCDDGLVQYLYYDLPYHEKADLTLFLTLSRKSQTIVDIGANTGLFSVLASLSNPQARLFAFEPYAVNAGRLKDNLELNGIRNVKVFDMAIGESEGEIELATPANDAITDVSSVNQDFSRKIYPNVKWASSTVKINRLDRVAQDNNWKIDLIKCDVESFEMSVFKGAERILAEDRPTILFECFLDEERQSFFNQLLSKYDYHAYLVLEQGVVHVQEGFVPSQHGLNYLITPVKPTQTFIAHENTEELCRSLLRIRS